MVLKKLQIASRIFRDEEKRLASVLQGAQQDYLSAQVDLDRALAYRAEYLEMSEGNFNMASSLLKMKAARLFLTQVDNLVAQQREVVMRKKETVESCSNLWMASYKKMRSVETLIESSECALRRGEEKREQMQMDDLFLTRRMS